MQRRLWRPWIWCGRLPLKKEPEGSIKRGKMSNLAFAKDSPEKKLHLRVQFQSLHWSIALNRPTLAEDVLGRSQLILILLPSALALFQHFFLRIKRPFSLVMAGWSKAKRPPQDWPCKDIFSIESWQPWKGLKKRKEKAKSEIANCRNEREKGQGLKFFRGLCLAFAARSRP